MSEATFCWQCGKKLMLPYFAEITSPDGTVLRVHKVCKKSALASFKPGRSMLPSSFATYLPTEYESILRGHGPDRDD